MVSGTLCPYVSVSGCEVVSGAAAPEGPITYADFFEPQGSYHGLNTQNLLSIGHRPLRGHCPSHHHTLTYTHIGAKGTADHLTLLRLFYIFSRIHSSYTDSDTISSFYYKIWNDWCKLVEFATLASSDDTLSISHKENIKKFFFHEKHLIEKLFSFLWFAVYKSAIKENVAASCSRECFIHGMKNTVTHS